MNSIGTLEILPWILLVTIDWQHVAYKTRSVLWRIYSGQNWAIPARLVGVPWLIKSLVVLCLFWTGWPFGFHIEAYRDAVCFLMLMAGLNAFGILALYNIRGFLSLFHQKEGNTCELSTSERNVNLIAVSISALALSLVMEAVLYWGIVS